MSTYDLTGADPDFLREDIRFGVFEANQRMFLKEPAFASTLVVRWLDGITNPILVEGIQWRTTYEDRDYAAMSDAKLIDSGFTDVLVSSLENLEVFSPDRVYSVEYQALKLLPSEEDPGTDGPVPTPGLLTELIQDVDFLKLVKNPLGDITSDAIDGIKALNEDVTGVDDLNLVEDERHAVNVPNNQMVIRPAAGAFWAHDVVLTNVATTLTLVEGTDYKFIGWNRAKQTIAEHTSQVYDYIFLLTPIVGDVDVTYRAFGGAPTVGDINAIKDVLAEITAILTDGELLTNAALPLSPTIIDIIARVAAVEDIVRHYATSTHQYQDDDAGRHWFTIANLYRDVWDTQTLETGQVHLSLRNWIQKWNYDILVTVNLKRAFDRVTVKTLASTDKNNVFSLGKYDDILDRKIPELRVVWNEVGGVLSGAQLQIGLEMEAVTTEVLTVYDRSGSGSDFNIRPNVVGTDIVYDDNVVLPDDSVWVNPYRGVYANATDLSNDIPVGETGWFAYVTSTTTIWQWTGAAWADSTDTVHVGIGTPTSQVEKRLICPEEGYLAWAGALPLTEVQDPADQIATACIKEGDFDFRTIKKVSFHVYDRIDDFVRVVSDERMPGAEGSYYPAEKDILRNGSVMFYPDDLCAIKYTITDTPTPNSFPVLALVADLGSHSIANDRFDLRQVVFYF